MRAIILAAGRGTHMTMGSPGAPACTLPFGKKSVLDRMIASLVECGIGTDAVTVVLGYGADEVVLPKGAVAILNEEFETTDNARSLRVALERLGGCREGVLVLDANMVCPTEALRLLVATGGSAALVVEGGSESCRTGVLSDPDGKIFAIGKHLPSDSSHFGGALALDPADAHALLAKLRSGDYDRDWYTVPLNELLCELNVRAVLAPCPVVKMGTDEEYLYAKRVFGVDKLSVLLVGASGFLGAKMRVVLSRRYDVVGTSRTGDAGLVALNPLDAERLTAAFEMYRPDVVVNLVGLADPERCDGDQALAYDLNVRVVEVLAAECRARGASLVQVSTDYVFDGESGAPNDKDSERRPKNYYGMTKKVAEDVAKSLPRSLIVRVPVLYGYNGHNDKMTFPTRALEALRARRRFPCDDRQLRYPALIDDVCEAVGTHLTDTGVLHVSSTKPVTKYQWAKVVAREFHLDESLVIRSNSPTKTNRPMHVCLSLEGGGIEARGIEEGTRAMARQMSCSFDLVYRCKPMDLVGPSRVADFRVEMGRALAHHYYERIPADADYVVPVPNSGLYYAMGLSEVSGVPYIQALVKRDAEKRSYQLQSLAEREIVLKGNVVPVPELVEGKRLVIVDEAIFTGVTIRTVCDALRACGALSVDVFIPTPVCRNRCPYNVQPSRPMLAESVSPEEMAECFRVRSVQFGSWADFARLTQASGAMTCVECFAQSASINSSSIKQ